MINGYFVGEKVVSTSPPAFSLYEKSLLGEKKGKKIEYSNVEVLYLVDGGKMKVVGRKHSRILLQLMRPSLSQQVAWWLC